MHLLLKLKVFSLIHLHWLLLVFSWLHSPFFQFFLRIIILSSPLPSLLVPCSKVWVAFMFSPKTGSGCRPPSTLVVVGSVTPRRCRDRRCSPACRGSQDQEIAKNCQQNSPDGCHDHRGCRDFRANLKVRRRKEIVTNLHALIRKTLLLSKPRPPARWVKPCFAPSHCGGVPCLPHTLPLHCSPC